MATEDTETPDAVALAQAAKIAGGLRDVRYGEDAGAGAEASGASEPAMVGFEGVGMSVSALDALVEQLSRGEVPEPVISEADVQGLIEGLLAKCAAKGIPESELADVIAEIRGNIGASREHLGVIRESAHRGVEHVVAESIRLKTERAIEQMNKLWEEIDKLNVEAGKRLDQLPLTKDEKDERKELEDAAKKAKESGDTEAKIKAQEELVIFYNKMGIKYDDPELLRLADRLGIATEQAKKIDRQIQEDKIRESGQKETATVEASGAEPNVVSLARIAVSQMPSKAEDKAAPFSMPSGVAYSAENPGQSTTSGQLSSPSVPNAADKSAALGGDF